MYRSKPLGSSFVHGPVYSSLPDSSSERLAFDAEVEANVGPTGLLSTVETPPERIGSIEIVSWPPYCSHEFSTTHVAVKNDLGSIP